MPKFDEEENKEIDAKIKHLVINMTRTLKQCEKNIKLISKNIELSDDDDIERVLINNMKMNLAEKIKDFTLEFRKNQEKYMKNYKELVESSHGSIDNFFEDNPQREDNSNFIQTEVESNSILVKRDKDISTMLKSIGELAEIFKDMQSLVSHQGTILDRIDYNIDSTLTNTKEAHKHLKKAQEHMKGNCFRNSMRT